MLGQPLIGTGGWAYFMIPGKDSLSSYSQLFNFVEINSTFYALPELSLVRSWRQRVPTDFQFSVRCHRDITHRYMLEPNDEALGLYERMTEICSILQAQFILLQTPRSFRFNQEKFRSITEFFSTATNGPRVVLEVRRGSALPLPKELLDIMQDLNIIHCTDVSVELPAYDSDIIYTRLFGPGNRNIYQFTDEEMKKRGLEPNEVNERCVRELLRKEYGMAAYAKLNLPRIDSARKHADVVLDGLYSWEEYTFLKDYYGEDFYVVAVWASPKTRHARLANRSKRGLMPDEAASRDRAEIENVNKGGPIAMADFTIINESSLEDLKKEARKIISRLK